jgi:hypothetical protein
MKQQIETDIWDWLQNYIEVDHKFYDYKFPPCPYAKSARLRGLVTVTAYKSGSINQFIRENTAGLISEGKHNVGIMVFPASTRWRFWNQWYMKWLNRRLIPQDFYIQYGMAVTTTSKYPGESAPYFIAIVNKLSDVLAGHQALLNTKYYQNWSDFHYNDVVVRRQRMYEKYLK